MSTKDTDNTTEPEGTPSPDTVEPAETVFQTPEDVEHEAALAELAAANEAKEAEKTPDPKDVEEAENEAVAGQGEDKESQEPKPDEPKTDDTMVPVAAVHESRVKLRASELENARLHGVIDTLQQGDTPPAETPKSAEEKIADVRSQKIALAQKFEDGEIGPVEHERARQALEDDEFAIREENRAQPAATTPAMDSGVEENMVRLESEHPALLVLNNTQMSALALQAREHAESKGHPIGVGAIETKRWHNLMGALATHNAAFSADPAEPAAKPDPSVPSPETTKPAELSPAARDREKALETKQNHPPDLNAIGTTADAEMSDDQISAAMNNMSEDQAIDYLDKLPPARYKRLAGVERPPGA